MIQTGMLKVPIVTFFTNGLPIQWRSSVTKSGGAQFFPRSEKQKKNKQQTNKRRV